jgi:hypothetical protein
MKNFTLYQNMLATRLTNPAPGNWTMSDELKALGYPKAGPFAENAISEVCHSKSLNYQPRALVRIAGTELSRFYGKDKFITDGHIQNHPIHGDFYIESKMYAFNSAGTANEKMAGFLDKANHYDKPVLLILGGEFELTTYFESNCILAAANLLTPNDYLFSVNNTLIGKNTDELIKSGKLKVCRLSQLINYL